MTKIKAISFENGTHSIECQECGKIFTTRNLKTTERFFKMHIEKTHGGGRIVLEDTQHNIDDEFARTGLNRSLVRVVRL